ncbi:Chaperone_HSP82 [Hexamita inflata]|uniref:Putative n=1 Tax=Hexamita inflata TaxID=28002 RepID=A0AA86UQS8_9EUKA|nr:Chaperone HSP82 [Hexamita inflata]CAI9979017.1 Chaperone HSP82 [Hexamita inflata]
MASNTPIQWGQNARVVYMRIILSATQFNCEVLENQVTFTSLKIKYQFKLLKNVVKEKTLTRTSQIHGLRMLEVMMLKETQGEIWNSLYNGENLPYVEELQETWVDNTGLKGGPMAK